MTSDFLGDDPDSCYSQFLFDTLRTAVLYLDKWGRIRSANDMAKKLFDDQYLTGKTALEVFGNWDKPIQSYQEILQVARTGHSVTGLNEKIYIDGVECWFQTDKIAVENASHGFRGVVYTLDDISQLTQQKQSLSKSEANYRAFIENSDDTIWRVEFPSMISLNQKPEILVKLIRQQAVFGDCNDLFNKIYEIDDNQSLQGIQLQDITFQDKLLNIEEFVSNKLRLCDKAVEFELSNDEYKYLKTSVQGIVTDEALVGIWGVTRDITELRWYTDRLEYQATHDVLTGLPNRIQLQSLVEQSIVNCQKDKKVALMIIDLDSFKEINDTLGHDIGDYIIQEIGPRIKQQLLGASSVIARLGGDEFAILLVDINHQSQAEIVGKQVLNGIRKYFHIGNIDVEIRASMGISIYPDQASDFSTLLRYADVAMYCAKKDMIGLEVYDSERDAHSPKRLSLISELGKAIRNNDLTLYFQPKVSVCNQNIVGVEALARWTHPVMGFISPAEFVPIAEMTDLINDMTDWVLDESLRQVKVWRRKSLDIKIAVNISARNLLQENFCEHVECLLADHDLPASCLGLEITESTIMKNTEQTLLTLHKLNEVGVELSIDDFGTGYSLLAYLKRLPVKWLKIDYSFIINMLQDEQDQIIVNSTINMAHNLGLQVIAEGVENKKIMQCLGDMYCEQAQGFHIARPMPAFDFEKWYLGRYSD
ncbi:hypothetical protein AB835_05400 [Candidatus Endobugula sertula]|uniref:Diguanylate cyclase n=1 Tax=Candidatus Endobugula sertula TaxID=62101 RepID=A0A1D2QR86_9GAMM|nr:hypothetical protein AB835_05400 [Candidatus Endobugula sertula]